MYDFGEQADSIDYEKIYNSRFKVLKKAFERFEKDEAYNNFIKENNIDIIDIKFNSSCSIYGEEQIYCFSALIMYESNNKE